MWTLQQKGWTIWAGHGRPFKAASLPQPLSQYESKALWEDKLHRAPAAELCLQCSFGGQTYSYAAHLIACSQA